MGCFFRKFCFLALVVIGVSVVSCGPSEKEDGYAHGYKQGWEEAFTSFDKKLEGIKEELLKNEFDLELKILALESDFNSEKFETSMNFLKLSRDKVVFDLSDPQGFRRIDTELGIPLYLSIQAVSPYMNGYKISLTIGNPSSVTIADLTLKLDWWLEEYFDKHCLKNDEDCSEVKKLKNIKSKSQKLLIPIEGGRWNSVELIVPSMTEKDAKSFRIMVDASVISLGT